MVPQYPTLTSRLTFPTMSRFHQEMHDWPFYSNTNLQASSFQGLVSEYSRQLPLDLSPTLLVSKGLTWHILVEPILHLCDHHSSIHNSQRQIPHPQVFSIGVSPLA